MLLGLIWFIGWATWLVWGRDRFPLSGQPDQHTSRRHNDRHVDSTQSIL